MKIKIITQFVVLWVLAALLVSACGAGPTGQNATAAPDGAASIPPVVVETTAPEATDPPAAATATDLPADPQPTEAMPVTGNATAEVAPGLALECSAPAELTPAQTEGPYYTPNTPERAVLVEDGMPGTHLILEGYVLAPDCTPIANAKIDFWQADANGVYDNQGYTLRGHQFSDENGYYRLESVVPGEYPGRPPHIHVKVTPPGGAEITSQVYFPGFAGNEADRIYNPATLVKVVSEGQDSLEAEFLFVVNMP